MREKKKKDQTRNSEQKEKSKSNPTQPKISALKYSSISKRTLGNKNKNKKTTAEEKIPFGGLETLVEERIKHRHRSNFVSKPLN